MYAYEILFKALFMKQACNGYIPTYIEKGVAAVQEMMLEEYGITEVKVVNKRHGIVIPYGDYNFHIWPTNFNFSTWGTNDSEKPFQIAKLNRFGIETPMTQRTHDIITNALMEQV